MRQEARRKRKTKQLYHRTSRLIDDLARQNPGDPQLRHYKALLDS